MWGAIWNFLKGLGSNASEGVASAASNVSSSAPAAATTTPSTGGFFSNIGQAIKSDEDRSKIANLMDQQGAQAQQQSAAMGQQVQSQGMSAMNNSTVQPTVNSTPIGIQSNYDPERLKRLMRIA